MTFNTFLLESAGSTCRTRSSLTSLISVPNKSSPETHMLSASSPSLLCSSSLLHPEPICPFSTSSLTLTYFPHPLYFHPPFPFSLSFLCYSFFHYFPLSSSIIPSLNFISFLPIQTSFSPFIHSSILFFSLHPFP